MAFPHPQSRKSNHRKRDISNNWRVVRKLFKRAVNVTDNRNAEEDVNPAENRTLPGISHSIPFLRKFAAHIFQSAPRVFSAVSLQRNRGCILSVAPELTR